MKAQSLSTGAYRRYDDRHSNKSGLKYGTPVRQGRYQILDKEEKQTIGPLSDYNRAS